MPQVEHLYERAPPQADGTPAKQEGDCMIITSDIYCNQHTALAARTAAGCAAEVSCSPAYQGSVAAARAQLYAGVPTLVQHVPAACMPY
jgi:hypothetical protein